MAAVAAARRLTETHRLAQARLGARTVLAMRAVWRLLDPEDVDGTFDRWLTAALPILRANRSSSATLAGNYMSTFKTIELGGLARVPVVLADALPVEAVTTSLLVTGPISLKQAAARGVPLDRARAVAESNAARAALRHVLDGGRRTLVDTVAADRQAIGWARATSGKPCYFCAMVASRGPVYKTESTADFEAHDGCSCTVEPVYRRDAAWPAGSEQHRDLWQQAKAADGDTVANFRRLIEGRG